jgi:hypothetical protein
MEQTSLKQVAPEVKEVTEEIPGTGQWHQKFTLFMSGDPVTEQPFDRTGTKLDLSDPQVRIDLWKTLKDHRFSD